MQILIRKLMKLLKAALRRFILVARPQYLELKHYEEKVISEVLLVSKLSEY